MEDKELHRLVLSNMMHTCHNGVNNCKQKDGTCKRGYPNTELREKSNKFDEKEYPFYKRTKRED